MSTGAVQCGADVDTDTTYIDGAGLSLMGTTFGVDFGGDGTATTVSRSDHTHTDDAFCPRLAAWDGIVRAYVSDRVTLPDVTISRFGFDEMIRVGTFWIDRYEATIGDDDFWDLGNCNVAAMGAYRHGKSSLDWPAAFPETGNWSPVSGSTAPAYACSVPSVDYPSAFLTWFQAAQACAIVGKRLCTNVEWQTAAASTADPGSSDGTGGTCVTNGTGMRPPGGGTACRSRWGAEDMIGNVWEWVADWHGKDSTTDGLLTNVLYGDDYMIDVSPADVWGGGQNFPAAALRGGAWTDGANAGAFALKLSNAPSAALTNTAIGARCCAGGQ